MSHEKNTRNSMMKVLSILLSLLVVVSLVGCSKADEDSKPTSSAKPTSSTVEEEKETYTFPLEEPVTMSMFGATLKAENPLDELLAFKEIEKRTNVLWDVTAVTKADVKEKRGLMLSTGEYTDVLMKSEITEDELIKYGDQGIILELTDLIAEYAPNLTKLMEEDPTIRYAISSADGKIYSLPGINRVSTGYFGWKKCLSMKNGLKI